MSPLCLGWLSKAPSPLATADSSPSGKRIVFGNSRVNTERGRTEGESRSPDPQQLKAGDSDGWSSTALVARPLCQTQGESTNVLIDPKSQLGPPRPVFYPASVTRSFAQLSKGMHMGVSHC